MESGETSGELVAVPKHSYERVRKALMDKDNKIQELTRKLIASENLSNLLQRKDAELRQAKENAVCLRASLRKFEASQRREVNEKFAVLHSSRPSEPMASIRHTLEQDGESCKVLKSDDVVPDSAAPIVSHVVDRKSPKAGMVSESMRANSLSLPQSKVARPVQTQMAPGQTSSSSPSLPCHTSSSSVTSKDLMDKVMQQNARLRKAINDVLMQKGLSVFDYLEKREYEDAVEMLRQQVKCLENKIIHLQAIINSRDSGEIDQLSRKCSDLTTTVSQLKRKLALQQAYVQEANKQLLNVKQSASPNVESKTTDAPCEDLKRVNGLLEELHQVKAQVAKLEEAKQRDSEQIIQLQKQQEDMRSILSDATGRLAAKEEAVARLQKLYDDVEAEKHVLKSQVTAFEEDFNVERKEKMEQKEHFEQLLVQHQEWMRKLASEAQSLRTSLETTRAEKELLESRLLRTSVQSCASQNLKALPRSSSNLASNVLVDGDTSNGPTNFVCRRCDREFSTHDKFLQHCEKCIDE